MGTPLATFTPSLVDPETLEKLFVAREPVLADLVSRASKAADGQSLLHRLLIGPRGAGKTHLLSLANHRISRLDPAPTIAWLPEDPWMIDDYADLLREILKAAARTAGAASADSRRLSSEALEEKIRKRADDGGPIVVLAENFDRILETIDVAGQRRLRRLTENGRTLLLLVTATRLTAHFMEQDGPFYGFFSPHGLAPFSVNEAADMLARVAEHRGDEALATRLREPRATDRYRLAAIDALAGGQPRIWALLASALTVDGLDSLADTLLTRFDDLTPYYQEQLGRLAPRERKVVRTLADLDQALNVKEIAEVLGVDQKSLAKTVSTLRREGWLAEVPVPLGIGDARKTYFELAEPLARLAFRLKDNRGEAISLLVSFLSTWFSRKQPGATVDHLSDFVRRHLDAAMDHLDLHDIAEAFGTLSPERTIAASPRPPLLGGRLQDAPLLEFVDALQALGRKDPAPYLHLPAVQRQVLRSAVEEHGLEGAQRLCIELGSKSPEWIVFAEKLVADGIEDIPNQRTLAILYAQNERVEEAIIMLDGVLRDCTDRFGSSSQAALETRLARSMASSSIDDRSAISADLDALLADSIATLGVAHEVTRAVVSRAILRTATLDRTRALGYVEVFATGEEQSNSRDVVVVALRFLVIAVSEESGQDGKTSKLLDELLSDSIRTTGPDSLMSRKIRRLFEDGAIDPDGESIDTAAGTNPVAIEARVVEREKSALRDGLVSLLDALRRTDAQPLPECEPIVRKPGTSQAVAEPPAPPYGSGTSQSQ